MEAVLKIAQLRKVGNNEYLICIYAWNEEALVAL